MNTIDMKAISLRKGLYQVLETYLETYHNGKEYPIANVLFKGEKSMLYEKQTTKVRLGSLYNPKSDGPKHIPYNDLKKYILHVQNLLIIPNEIEPHKPHHCAVWELLDEQNYREMFDELSAIDCDFHLQEMEILELHNSILSDEALQDDFDANLVNVSLADDEQLVEVISSESDLSIDDSDS
ncbi:hypothetical protein ACS5PU_08695 [Pedobacter sp. GSP4]|uniref:hypothetical protein n=1 Tax=Pedobacter sp. GSP4 TaxID=3453716 RepID=UPI003EE8DFEC